MTTTHGALTPLYQAAARAPGLKRLSASTLGVRIITGHYRGQAVKQTLRYTLRDVLCRGSVHRYRLRGTDVGVYLRHGTSDGNIAQEFAVFRVYEPPMAVRARIPSRPRILDLGGHVGLFGAYALTLWPEAHVVSYEPDPANVQILARTARESGLQWEVVQAAAWTHTTTLSFCQDFAESRIDPDGDVTVGAVDVLPQLGEWDLVKIDIEGAEWALFADERFPSSAPRAMVIECHPPTRGVDAQKLLTGWGYRTARVEGAGAVMMWAWR